MKKFRFSLETVLDYKQQLLEAVQAEHAAALSAVHRQEERIEELWQSYRAYNKEFCESKEAGLMITEALMYEGGLRAMERQIQQETLRLEELRKIEEQKRSAMIEARKETASLEKLKEKKLDMYEKAVQKSEEAFIEEFVSNSRAVSCTA